MTKLTFFTKFVAMLSPFDPGVRSEASLGLLCTDWYFDGLFAEFYQFAVFIITVPVLFIHICF